ncbi:hypothetical protein [Bacillus wiedmannii]|uniref:hypothetical protein n=1 Tax=Bacillus wiedmannii TaxID=1890302 RepID=UPI0007CB059E|nr:hypothetical protein [Bacillus wiedmannii]OAK32595.1 hypothetical protein A6284_28335 [Bacillus wiedmannii]
MVVVMENEKQILEKAKGVMLNFEISLSANARLLYVALLVAGERELTHSELSGITDIKSATTLRRVIRELEHNGFIEVIRHSHGQTYKVL